MVATGEGQRAWGWVVSGDAVEFTAGRMRYFYQNDDGSLVEIDTDWWFGSMLRRLYVTAVDADAGTVTFSSSPYHEAALRLTANPPIRRLKTVRGLR